MGLQMGGGGGGSWYTGARSLPLPLPLPLPPALPCHCHCRCAARLVEAVRALRVPRGQGHVVQQAVPQRRVGRRVVPWGPSDREADLRTGAALPAAPGDRVDEGNRGASGSEGVVPGGPGYVSHSIGVS
jgi:hypothetical protein